jgi:hypothetical protein
MKGDKGETGAQGVQGPAGRDGVNGVNGVNGKDGVDGNDGRDGRDGKDGKDGKDGRDGKDCCCIPQPACCCKDGKDGADGANGKDGKDAEICFVDLILWDKANGTVPFEPTDSVQVEDLFNTECNYRFSNAIDLSTADLVDYEYCKWDAIDNHLLVENPGSAKKNVDFFELEFNSLPVPSITSRISDENAGTYHITVNSEVRVFIDTPDAVENDIVLGVDVGVCGKHYVSSATGSARTYVPKVFTESIVKANVVDAIAIDDLNTVDPEVDPANFALINIQNVNRSATKIMNIPAGDSLDMYARIKFAHNLPENINRLVVQVSKVTLSMLKIGAKDEFRTVGEDN